MGGLLTWSCSGCEDLCAGVSCNNYCSGNTRYYDGSCAVGSCQYSQEVCAYGCVDGDCLPAPSPSPSVEVSAYPEPSLTLPSPSASVEARAAPSVTPTSSVTPAVTLTPLPSVAATPTPTFAVVVSPTIWESASPYALPSSSPRAAQVDIRCADSFEIGKQKIFVFVDGSLASGKLVLSDGAGSRFERMLERDGSTEFFFDKAGEWIIDYNGTKKKGVVRERKRFVAPPLQDLREGVSGRNAPGALTGLFSWGMAPEWIAVIVLLFALVEVAYHRFYYSAPRLRKSFDGKKVSLSVSAGRKALENILLTDYAPDDCVVSNFSEKASVSDTVTGKVLKWRRDSLRPREVWSIEYELSNAGVGRLKQAEAVAVDASGKRVSLLS
ncbi:MAG: hypothetical protein QW343_01420 [Candidatus Norongarragalinales archaeon]